MAQHQPAQRFTHDHSWDYLLWMLHNSKLVFLCAGKNMSTRTFCNRWREEALHFSLSLYLLNTLSSAPRITTHALIIKWNVLSDRTVGDQERKQTRLPKYSTTPLSYSCNDERKKIKQSNATSLCNFNWQLNTVFQQCRHNHLQLKGNQKKQRPPAGQ